MSMPSILKQRLVQTALTIMLLGAGAASMSPPGEPQPSEAVLLAMDIGAYYESSGRHIGTPYVDKVGKGQPLTVCNGVTGPEVVAGRYYTKTDCMRLELPMYLAAEAAAKRMFRHWSTYNVWVQASLIDMIYNLGEAQVAGSTMRALANAGDLDGACAQMPKWVRGTVNGKSAVLAGLVDRRGTTAELCSSWGRDGHFMAGVLP